MVKEAGPYLAPYLNSEDPEHRGFAALAAGAIKEKRTQNLLEGLCRDRTEICVYLNCAFERISVGEIAENALSRF